MTNSYHVGQLVVCIRTRLKHEAFIVGHVGEIQALATPSIKAEGGEDCVIYFPALKNTPCPSCGMACHEGHFAMAFDEIKPIEDPDKGQAEEENRPIEFGFAS